MNKFKGINIKGKEWDISSYTDISIGVSISYSPTSFHLQKPIIKPIGLEFFSGSVVLGASCNVDQVSFIPHGSSTHTECAGHISKDHHVIMGTTIPPFMITMLVTLTTENNRCFLPAQFNLTKDDCKIDALIMRTNPNDDSKLINDYSSKNPAYLDTSVIEYCNSEGVKHILVDLPSVDKEDDNQLINHHLFFGNEIDGFDLNKTITEFIYVPDNILDGLYLLNLQIVNFESDAVPSRPLLFNQIK